MKGNKKLLDAMNHLLSMELAAVNQYVVHAEMCENWGYEGLQKSIMARTVEEMKHAEKLIARILFMEGTPVVNRLAPIKIGADVPKQFASDHAAELGAVETYNAAIKLAVEVGDNATRELLEGILHDEDRHVDDIEAKQDQIGQLGVQMFLSQQIKE